jgi:hypothetical protein
MAVGVSTLPGERAAAAEAIETALKSGPAPAFALVLSTDQYEPLALSEAITGALGGVPWAGCCAPGVFAGSRLLPQGLVIGAITSPASRFGVGLAPAVSEDGRWAGAAATERALAGLASVVAPGCNRALVILSDATVGNSADVVRGAMEVAGTGFIWAGAGVGDRTRQPRGAQFAHGHAYTDSVVVIAIDSPVRMAAGISHGFRPYGAPTLVTRANGAVAAELEYEAAFPVYQRTARERGDEVSLESFTAFATTHPLGIPRADGEHVIRDPLEVEADGGLRCFAEVPDGCLIRVMEGDRAGLLGAARDATAAAREAVGGPLAGAVVFDCISRHLMLGEGFAEELEIFAAQVGGEVPLIGCLTFGEIGALGRGLPQFHNKTAVVLALGR